MDKEKLKKIHEKRYLSDSWTRVNFKDEKNLQFFMFKKDYNGKEVIEGKCFTNKSFNSRWYYRFKNILEFEKYALMTIKNNLSSLQRKEEYRQQRQKPHTLKEGDILYCSWGYDQTQVDFFKVKEVIGKRKIKIVGLSTNAVSDGFHDKATPCDSGGNHWTRKQYYCHEDKKWKTKDIELLKLASSDNSVRITSYAYAYKWDGKPKYQTNSMAGH